MVVGRETEVSKKRRKKVEEEEEEEEEEEDSPSDLSRKKGVIGTGGEELKSVPIHQMEGQATTL